MNIIYLLICVTVLLLIMALTQAVWSKIVDRAFDYIESLLGEKVTNIIVLILFIVVTVLLIGKGIMS